VCKGPAGNIGYVVTNRHTFYECYVGCKRKLTYTFGADNIFHRQINDSSSDGNGGVNKFVNLPSIGHHTYIRNVLFHQLHMDFVVI